jgi:hypothetical protein
VGDEVEWGKERGKIKHSPDCNAKSSNSSPSPNGGRTSDEGSALEKTAFRVLEQLCASAGTADWDEQMLVKRAFKIADAFFKERAWRRKSAQGELPIRGPETAA